MPIDWPRLVDDSWVFETKKRIGIQKEHRKRLQESSPYDETNLRSLDSTLKKTTAFMKKVKGLNAATVPSAISDLSKLNLSKFVEEIAQAIAETKMKSSDIPSVVELCVELTARYASFPGNLLTEIKKNLPLKRCDKITNPAKLRIDLRFLCELIICDVFGKEGLQCLGSVMTYLTATDKMEFVHVGLICSFCRPVGYQIAGIIPLLDIHHGQTGGDFYEDDLPSGPVSATNQKLFFDLLVDYLNALVGKVDKACATMNAVQKKVKRQERTRGDASAEDKNDLETAKTEFDRLKSLARELSFSLGMQLKTFTEEPSDDEEDELAAAEMDNALKEGQVVLWPDDETKAFYVNLLDIKAILPKNCYKESEQRTVETSKMETSIDDVNLEGLEAEQETVDQPQTSRENTSSPPLDADQIQEILAPLTEDMKEHMKKFLHTMDHLVNREVTDQAALDFVSHLNTKSHRKRLVKLLVGCSHSRMDLIPFYARLVATLSSVMPDVTAEVVNSLIQSFRKYIQRSNNEDRIESKLLCVMFISELVKFGVIPRAEALSCLRQLVYDFRWHFIDMACIILETAGYYLYRNADSHPKMKIILDVIIKKRERIKDVRHVMLIDNAFYACIPAENGSSTKHDTEPEMYKFIRLMVQTITEDTVDSRIKALRRIDWLNESILNFCLRQLSSPWLIPYSNLPALASTIAGLRNLTYHDWIGVWIIDTITEIIRLSLEIPGIYNQQAISCVTLLGELYNYSVCDSAIVFKILYQLISFPEYDMESWQDFYRIRMVCEMLNIVGEFFYTGNAGKKMDYFLIYFRRFYWCKKELWLFNMQAECAEAVQFPADVESDFNNSMRKMRKNSPSPKNLEECEKAVAAIEDELKSNINVPFENLEIEEDEGRQGPDRNLTQIREEDEDESDDQSIQPKSYASVCGYDDHEEDKILIHMKAPEKTADDEEFEREFERMIAEANKNPTNATAPSMDMTVPSGIRQKFSRNICFADTDEKELKVNETKQMNKVALMTRGKGNKAILKTVTIDEQKLHDSWQKEREREEEERAIMKKVTLGHSARMEAEEEQEKKVVTHSKKYTGRQYR